MPLLPWLSSERSDFEASSNDSDTPLTVVGEGTSERLVVHQPPIGRSDRMAEPYEWLQVLSDGTADAVARTFRNSTPG